MVAGKARRFGSPSASHTARIRNQDALYGLERGNDAQIGGQQFGSQEGFTPIAQTGLQDTSKAFGSGQQFTGGIGFNRQICELTESSGLLDITEEAVSNDLFDVPPGDCSIQVIGGDGLTSDLTTIQFPKFQGHRLCIFLNVLQTITVKHTAGATVYAIKTPNNRDVVFSGATQAIQLVWSVVLGQWLLTTRTVCPIICQENDLGTVNNVVDLDWSLASFHRAVLDGDTTFNIINTPGATQWQDICLEVQQDEVGGHSVSFIQGFANNFIPMAIQGAGRYTSWQLYTYEKPPGIDIFQGFDKSGNNGPQVPGGGGLFQGFAGYIQAILSATQALNIAVGDHIEFDTIVSNDTITVTSGAGQASGIFQGFRPGHTYECEAYLTAEGMNNQLNLGAKWFDRNASALIGTEGTVLSTNAPGNQNTQFVAKAMFQSTSLADELEVQITNDTQLTDITDGSVADEPTCFVTIKDCGIIESVINEPEPDPTEGELDIREFIYAECSTNSILERFANFQQNGSFSNIARVDEPIIRNMRIKALYLRVSVKGANDRSFNYEADGVQRGPLFIIPGGFTGTIEFTPLDIALNKDELIGMTSIGGSVGDEWSLTAIVWYL